jgi:hypothetical protein
MIRLTDISYATFTGDGDKTEASVTFKNGSTIILEGEMAFDLKASLPTPDFCK